jgi:8-oxo-dGTP pyrophosphatase MutT (NUDIX family)
LFALLEARGTDPEGKPLLPYVLLRGHASVVIPVCRNRATGERRFLMVRQRRIGNGAMSLEFPAGMVDGDPPDPVATAARELEEETGLCVEPSALTPLWDRGLCSAPGLSDEAVHFYAVEIDLDDTAFRALEGGAAGHAHEGEHITTTLLTYAEAAPEITSMHPLLGFFLYHRKFGTLA